MNKKTGSKHEKPKYYHPPNVLKQRVGTGGLPEEHLIRAEQYIQDNEFDFKPVAIEIMERFKSAVAAAKKSDKRDKAVINEIIKPIMELKANGDMFRYALLTEVAEILLNFLENIQDLNDDSFHVIDAHRNTLEVILKNDLRGSGGVEGHALSKELYAACRRYYSKHNVDITG